MSQGQIALDKELDDLLGNLADKPIPFLNAIPDADGNIQLGRDVVTSLRSAIIKAADVQQQSSCTLSVLSLAFRAFEYDGEISGEDAYALVIVAAAQAERASDNAEQIRSLIK